MIYISNTVTFSYNKQMNLLPKSNNRWCLWSIALPACIVHQRTPLWHPQDTMCYQLTVTMKLLKCVSVSVATFQFTLPHSTGSALILQ